MHPTGISQRTEQWVRDWSDSEDDKYSEDDYLKQMLENQVSMLEHKITKIKLRHIIKRDIANLLRPIYVCISDIIRSIDKWKTL